MSKVGAVSPVVQKQSKVEHICGASRFWASKEVSEGVMDNEISENEKDEVTWQDIAPRFPWGFETTTYEVTAFIETRRVVLSQLIQIDRFELGEKLR